jgi:hypothetical protein
VHTGFWWEKPEGSYYLKDLGVDGRIILKMDLQAVV